MGGKAETQRGENCCHGRLGADRSLLVQSGAIPERKRNEAGSGESPSCEEKQGDG